MPGTSAWEIGSEGMESANKLNVLYVFENKVCCTDAFMETIELIITNESFQKDFQWILDKCDEDDPLRNHAIAFVTIHITRLGIPYTNDDLYECVLMLHALFKLGDEKMDGLLSRIIPKR